MTDELKDEHEESETLKEGDLPAPGALVEEENPDDDAFLEGFGEESLDPEEADALAMGYRIRGGGADEDEEEFFSGDDE